MYLENMGIRSIERLTGITDTTIINWIRKPIPNVGKLSNLFDNLTT